MVLVVLTSAQCEPLVLFVEEGFASVALPSTPVRRVSPATAAAQFLHETFASVLTDAQMLDLGVIAE